MERKIGIFGGTFDPVHKEHQAMAENVIKELNLDRLIVVPTFIPPHKMHNECADANHRINMLKLAFGNEKIEISDYEIESGGKSYTYKTLEHFKSAYPNDKLYFILGEDMLVDFKTWRNPKRITELCDIVAFRREGYQGDHDKERAYFLENFGKKYILLNYAPKNVSSTKIRVYASFMLPIPDVAQKVEEYIQENLVYPTTPISDIVRINLPLKRLRHTANVVTCALKKVKELNLDREKVITACSLHDVAKYMPISDFPIDVLPKNMVQPVAHAYLGEYYARVKLGITDKDVLNAIKHHTSGRANMSTLEKLVFVADMVEESRDYDGVEYLRKLYETAPFEECFVKCLEEEMIHLKNKGNKIYEKTIEAYDYYVKEKKQ